MTPREPRCLAAARPAYQPFRGLLQKPTPNFRPDRLSLPAVCAVLPAPVLEHQRDIRPRARQKAAAQ